MEYFSTRKCTLKVHFLNDKLEPKGKQYTYYIDTGTLVDINCSNWRMINSIIKIEVNGYDYLGASLIIDEVLDEYQQEFGVQVKVINKIKVEKNGLSSGKDYMVFSLNSTSPQSSVIKVNPDGYTCCIEEVIPVGKKEKEKKGMSKLFKNLEFGPVKNSLIKMSIKGMAYETGDLEYVAYDKEAKNLVNVTDFIVDGFEDFLYVIPSAIKDVKVGDIVYHNGLYHIVTEVMNGSFKVVSPYSREVSEIMPEHNMFGFNFISKVVSLIGDNPFGNFSNDNPFGNMLPFLFLSEDKNNSNDMIKMMMLMNMNGVDNSQFNPIMLMLMNDSGKMKDILPLMLMQNNGFNIFQSAAADKECKCNCKKEDK